MSTDDQTTSGSLAPPNTDAVDAALPIAGLIRRATRDDRPRRSVSYRHTEPYELVVDRKTGLEYEVRACKYCDTAFSFKGGTTSAAMRHLRLAHPQEVFGVAGVPPPKRRAPVPTLLQILQEQGPSTEPSPSSQTHEEALDDVSTTDAVEAVEGTPQEMELGVPQDEGHTEEHQMPAVDQPVPAHEAVDDEQGERSSRPRFHYYKRRRYDDEHGGVNLPWNVNQVAIAHFIANYKHVLPPAKRFAFVKHLTYNDREAAMYNVLDDEMRLEFLTQFNATGSTTRST